MEASQSSSPIESEDLESPEAGLQSPDATPSVAGLASVDAASPVISVPAPCSLPDTVSVPPVAAPIDVAGGTKAVRAPRRRFFRTRVRSLHLPVKVHTFESFRYRDYRLVWAATFFGSAGFWLQQIVLGWLTYNVTQSAFWTSIAMGLDALPILLAGPIGGLIADAWDRRKLLVYIFAYQTLLTIAFSAVVLLGSVEVWQIFAFIFLMGASWVVIDPVRTAMIPNIVPRHSLINAFALSSMAFSATRMAVPVAGGVLIALVGPGPTLVAMAMFPLAAVSVSLGIKATSVSGMKVRMGTAPSQILEGARYVMSNPVMMGLWLMATVPSLLVMPFVHGLMPVYAAEVFFVGSASLGILLTFIGLGSTLGAILLASLGDVKYKGRLVFFGIALTAIGMAGFSQIPSAGLALPILVVLSMGVMLVYSTSSAIVQSIVPDEYRGRVSGLYVLTWGVTPVGGLMAGALAQNLGAPLATLIASGLVALALAWFALRLQCIWRLR